MLPAHAPGPGWGTRFSCVSRVVERTGNSVLSVGWLRCPAPLPRPAEAHAAPGVEPLPYHLRLEQQNREHRAAEPDPARSTPERSGDHAPARVMRGDSLARRPDVPRLGNTCPPPTERTVVRVRVVRPPPAATLSGRLFDLLA
jgi:hypothetical protein